MIKKFAVVGKDVSASTSPIIHKFIAKKLGFNIEYEKISVEEKNFGAQINGLLNGYSGLNFTIPYKLTVIPYLKGLCGDALAYGAVNTVDTRSLNGYNTDGLGFWLMLRVNNINVEGKRVLLLGAGGAGRSAAKKLIDGGARVDVYDANYKNAAALEREFGATALSSVKPESYCLIINATGVGMHKTVGLSPVDERILAGCDAAVDLIYVPAKSRFLEIAESLGKKTVNGEAMLFYQAYYAECIWFGLQPDEEQAKNLFREFTEKKL